MNATAQLTGAAARLSQRCRIEAICSQFEAAWISGKRPYWRQFIHESDDLPDLLYELLAVELHYRTLLGETPIVRDYEPADESQLVVIRRLIGEFAATSKQVDNTETQRRLPVIPGFEIVRELGRGGMGVVYLARQEQPQRLVALKMIRDGVLAHADSWQRFRMEANIVARLHHAQIVPIHSIGQDNGRPFMIFEYVAGGNLSAHLGGCPVAPRDAAHFMEMLARAIAYAHARGVIHRDLKPSNVLVTRSELNPSTRLSECVGKITDFGLAKLIESDSGLTATGDTLGTPSYMAPEQARGQQADVGVATDVYSLGAILYELLSGRPPFVGPSALSTLEQVANRDAVSLRQLQPGVPIDLETICMKCLDKLLTRRYSTANALADDLRRFQLGEPITARRLSVVESTYRWSKRHPTRVAIALCGLIGVAAQSIALVRLSQSRTAEQEARRTAETNLSHALDVSRTTLGIVTDDRELTDRGLYVLREKVLMALIAKCEPLFNQKPDDQDIQLQLARAQSDLSRVRYHLADHRGAMAASNRAIGFWQQIAATGNLKHKREFAEALIQRSILRCFERQCAAGIADAAKAHDLLTACLEQRPGDIETTKALATCCQARGALELLHESTKLPARRSFAAGLAAIRAIPVAQRDLPTRRQEVRLLDRYAVSILDDEHDAESIRLRLEAIDLLRQIIESHPEVVQLKEDLGTIQINLCDTLCRCQRFPEAVEQARQSVEVFKLLRQESPKVVSYVRRQTYALNNLASAHDGLGQWPEAELQYRAAVKLLDEFALTEPDRLTREFRDLAIITFHEFAGVLTHLGKPDDALLMVERAEALQSRGCDETPAPPYRAELLMIERARAHDAAARQSECLTAWDRAHEIVAGAEGDSASELAIVIAVGRALAFAKHGQSDSAVNAAREITNELAERAYAQTAELHYDLARVFSRCLSKTPSFDRRAECARHAIECLKKATSARYFEYSTQWATRIERHADFAFLRELPEFEAFRKTLSHR